MSNKKEFYIEVRDEETAEMFHNSLKKDNVQLCQIEGVRLFSLPDAFWDGKPCEDGQIHASLELVTAFTPHEKPWARIILWKNGERWYVDDTIGQPGIANTYQYIVDDDEYVVHTSIASKELVLDYAQQMVSGEGFDLGVDNEGFFVRETEDTDKHRNVTDMHFKSMCELMDEIFAETRLFGSLSNGERSFLQDGIVAGMLKEIRPNTVTFEQGRLRLVLPNKAPQYKKEPKSYNRFQSLYTAWQYIAEHMPPDKHMVETLNILRQEMINCRKKAMQEQANSSLGKLPSVPDVVAL